MFPGQWQSPLPPRLTVGVRPPSPATCSCHLRRGWERSAQAPEARTTWRRVRKFRELLGEWWGGRRSAAIVTAPRLTHPSQAPATQASCSVSFNPRARGHRHLPSGSAGEDLPVASGRPVAGSNSQKHFWGHCSLRGALGGPCRNASGRRGCWRRLGLEGAQAPRWGPSWHWLHRHTPPPSFVSSLTRHQQVPERPRPQSLCGHCGPEGGPHHSCPLHTHCSGPCGPQHSTAHRWVPGHSASRLPFPLCAESLPLVCSAGGGRGSAPGRAGAWLLAQRTRGLHSHQSARPRGPQAVWTHLSLGPSQGFLLVLECFSYCSGH